MTAKHKNIVLVISAANLGVMVLYWVVMSGFVEPSQLRDQQKQALRAKIAELTGQNAQMPQYDARYRKIVAKALPGSEAEAGSYLAAMIPTLLDSSRLGDKYSKKPMDDTKPKNGFKEIGHKIDVHGDLPRLVDLLYLLEAQPFLHRLDNLALSRQKSGEFNMTFNYMALAVDAKNRRVKPASQPATDAAPPVQNLDAPERRRYDAIVMRDLFRPYVKRIVEPTPPPVAHADDPPKAVEPPKPRRAEFFVCGLVTWDDGRQQVSIRNGLSGEIRDYKPGDKVDGAEVVMIDYRPMPRQDNPKLDSPSRLILKIGQEYWAVELERSLSEKRLLKSDQMPPELQSRPATEPGVAVGKATP